MTEEVLEGLFEEVAFEPKPEGWEAVAVGRVSRTKEAILAVGAMALRQERALFVLGAGRRPVWLEG